MRKLIGFVVFTLVSVGICSESFSAEEIYLTDARENPGKIFQILHDRPGRPGPFLWPMYFRKSGQILAVAFAGYGSAYFTDANRSNIYKTDGVSEDTIYTHNTYVRDLAFDSRSRLYFSESSGAHGNGVIYGLNQHTGKVSRFVTVKLDEIGGFWAGHFAFDSSNRLFISSGNRAPGSIYEYVGGHFRRRFTHSESITGFAFVDNRTLYFTNYRQKLYELREFRHLTVNHEDSRVQWLNDVAFVRVPEGGKCQISGRVTGGEDLWQMTFVEIYGPNVIWRKSAGNSIRVTGSGSYNFRNRPVGRYRVRTDVHGDTPAGFEPESHTVNCPGVVKNINFRYPR
jgi:hypothetical protein